MNRFFFQRETPWALAWMRIALAFVLLIHLLPRWTRAWELYSADGLAAPLLEAFGRQNVLPVLSGGWAIALHTALLFFTVAAMLGWFTRVSLLATATLVAYFAMLDGLGTLGKHVVIAVHFLVLLACSNCGAVLSLDAWRRRAATRGQSARGMPAPPRNPLFWPSGAVWPRRLMQFLLCAVYLGTAITKLKTPEYFTGQQLQYWFLGDTYGSSALGHWLANDRLVVLVMAYAVLLWEITFSLVVWTRWGRPIVLAFGICFHAGTWVLLGLDTFALVMFSTYLAFLEPEGARRVLVLWNRLRRRVFAPVRSSGRSEPAKGHVATPHAPHSGRLVPVLVRSRSAWIAAFVVLGGTSVLAGREIQFWQDRYGQFRADQPPELPAISTDEAMRLQDYRTVRPVDRFARFEIGTHVRGGFLFGQRDRFQLGDDVMVMIDLWMPHPDIYVECRLLDDQGLLLSRRLTVVPRETARWFFGFHIGSEVQPGRYDVVLLCADQELARRSVEVLP